MDQIKIFAPASVANVSCGFDVLGFCLDPIGDLMQVSKVNSPGVSIGTITGQELPVDPQKNVASVAVQALCCAFHTEKINICSYVPVPQEPMQVPGFRIPLFGIFEMFWIFGSNIVCLGLGGF